MDAFKRQFGTFASIFLCTLILSISSIPFLAYGAPGEAATILAATPPMGWNDWAHYGCDIDENAILNNAIALVNSGLAAKGYNTVTVDDCWMTDSRDVNGQLVANANTFPHGMAWLGAQLHSMGLKYGIYEDAGYATCEGYAGSGVPDGGGADHFEQDMKTFARWEVDYIKLDGCNLYIAPDSTLLKSHQSAYAVAAAAIKASGRQMTLSVSMPAYFKVGYGERGIPDWYSSIESSAQDGALWREGNDILYLPASSKGRWRSLMANYGYNRWLSRYAHPGGWNDPDFLIGGDPYLTAEEGRSQIALWAMMSSPLILSVDVTSISNNSIADLGNQNLIEIDQDAKGAQATVISTNNVSDMLVKPLANGDIAFAILNKSNAPHTFTTPLRDIGFDTKGNCSFAVEGLNNPLTVTWDRMASQIVNVTRDKAVITSDNVPAHAVAIYRVTPSGNACVATASPGVIVGNAGKCIDNHHRLIVDGNPINQSTCTGKPNQRWTVKADNTIQNVGRCMSTTLSPDSSVTLETCNGSETQKWDYQKNGNLVSRASRLCLQVQNGTSTNGQQLQIHACGYNQLNQIWAMPN